jgi:uncharacterized protein YbjT (DUF2867 family)
MVLVIGSTGFVGRFLCARLAEEGVRVRAFTRHVGHADAVLGRIKDIEIVRGDALEAGSIMRALSDENVVVFLATAVASAVLDRPANELDRRMTANLIRASSRPDPPFIVYLSALCDPERHLSSHIETQIQTEKELRDSGLPHCVFRAPVIVGRWGAFFRLCHTALERFKVMWLPKSVSTPCQPIYLGDVASYISNVIHDPHSENKLYEIGGHDVLSYQDMIELFASALGMSKVMVPMPLNFDVRAARLLSKYTGIPAQAIGAFLEDMTVPRVTMNDQALMDFPDIHPLGYMDALQKALRER